MLRKNRKGCTMELFHLQYIRHVRTCRLQNLYNLLVLLSCRQNVIYT